ncbi:MAG: hypothetical protein MRY79_02620 [Alphaproteobacteria bacterium]|nr:hypothetical protein [Alphaproteobacteria bacterium]
MADGHFFAGYGVGAFVTAAIFINSLDIEVDLDAAFKAKAAAGAVTVQDVCSELTAKGGVVEKLNQSLKSQAVDGIQPVQVQVDPDKCRAMVKVVKTPAVQP